LPCQREDVAPQFWQTKVGARRAMNEIEASGSQKSTLFFFAADGAAASAAM
jgi:hypothetical protein